MYGPTSPKGERPKYKDNGTFFILSSIVAFSCLIYWHPELGRRIYDNVPAFVGFANLTLPAALLLYTLGPSSDMVGKFVFFTSEFIFFSREFIFFSYEFIFFSCEFILFSRKFFYLVNSSFLSRIHRFLL